MTIIVSLSKKGVFIVFEGLDGSGLSTQANLLRDFLTEKGYRVLLTKEPTLESGAGREIRKILDEKKEMKALALQKLFAEDRKQHLEKVVLPALKKEKIVICDRYFFSSLAFGAAEGLALQDLINLNKQFPYPDLIFLLKVPPKVSIKRIIKRKRGRALFEQKEKLAATWQVYEKLSERFKKIKVVNGEQSIKKVFEDIKKIINRKSVSWRKIIKK